MRTNLNVKPLAASVNDKSKPQDETIRLSQPLAKYLHRDVARSLAALPMLQCHHGHQNPYVMQAEGRSMRSILLVSSTCLASRQAHRRALQLFYSRRILRRVPHPTRRIGFRGKTDIAGKATGVRGPPPDKCGARALLDHLPQPVSVRFARCSTTTREACRGRAPPLRDAAIALVLACDI